MVDLAERLDALLEQEHKYYTTVDYLDPLYQHRLLVATRPNCFNSSKNNPLSSSDSLSSESSPSSVSGINETWRERIAEWSYQVIDHYDYQREVVGISFNYLDRFLASRHVNKKMFQLASMSSLCLAIKLYEPKRISMKDMVDLSRGFFSVEQMKAMEMDMLRTLAWQVHPPTAFCFSKHILFLMPYTSISMECRHDILELCRFLTELSVVDYFFVARKASSVALAALDYSMHEIPTVSQQAKEDFAAELPKVSGLDLQNPEVSECRERLCLLYAQGGYGRPDSSTKTATDANTEEVRVETISPVCVSYGLSGYHSVAYVSQGLQTKAGNDGFEVNYPTGNIDKTKNINLTSTTTATATTTTTTTTTNS